MAELNTRPRELHPHACMDQINDKKYVQYLENAVSNAAIQQMVASFPIDGNDPLRWLYTYKSSFDFNFFWQTRASSHKIAAMGQIVELKSHGKERFSDIQQQYHHALSTTCHINATNQSETGFPLVGGFTFFDEVHGTRWRGFEAASLILPKYAIVCSNENCFASVAIAIDSHLDIASLHERLTLALKKFPAETELNEIPAGLSVNMKANDYQRIGFPHWSEMIEDAKNTISTGRLKKVVLARQLKLHLSEASEPTYVLRRLKKQYPGCYSFLMKRADSGTFLGSTPELLLSVQKNHARTEALAGSISRGQSHSEDVQLAISLQNSVKNKQEHRFVVDQIQQTLAPHVHNISFPDQPYIKKLSNVQHLFTPVKGTLDETSNVLQLLGLMHPTSAVGGTPRPEAMRFIREHENFNRGHFASPIGWISSNGTAEFAVAIRSCLLSKNTARLFAGCGIVVASDAEEEWQESDLKFKPIRAALYYD